MARLTPVSHGDSDEKPWEGGQTHKEETRGSIAIRVHDLRTSGINGVCEYIRGLNTPRNSVHSGLLQTVYSQDYRLQTTETPRSFGFKRFESFAERHGNKKESSISRHVQPSTLLPGSGGTFPV